MFALLLNTETKDEGEDFLDYSFPAEDPALEAVAPMKGVLLASVGVMKAATGQEVSFLCFRSTDGQLQYKAALLKVERWLLCVLVLASVSDRVARFLVEEAAGLAALRHGRLASLQGNFRQLDPIFRALGGLWRSTASRFAAEPVRSGDASAGLLYMSLGAVLWNPLPDDLREEVGQAVADWERRWQETAQDPPLATPAGCALFLDQELVSTSLTGEAFRACLRLCLLEGALHAGAIADDQWDGGVAPARCHSLFLEAQDGLDIEMPSHQYGVMRRGPWTLFMLWRMSSLQVRDRAATRGPPKKAATDPFGMDLCVELLSGLKTPGGYSSRSLDARAARTLSGPIRSSSHGSRDGIRRSFSLPCGVFKPSSSKKAKKQGSGSLANLAEAKPSFLHALELSSTAEGSDKVPCGFSKMQEPPQAARDRLHHGARLRCPEMFGRVASRECTEWAPACDAAEVLREWADLVWLVREHSKRRASWLESPGLDATRHPLHGALKGKQSLERLWEECVDEVAEGQEASWLDSNDSSPDRRKKKKPAAVKLGSGEPWRFQEGAPMLRSDLTCLTSAGSLLRPRPQAEATPTARRSKSSGEKARDSEPRARWVAIAAPQRAGAAAEACTLDAEGASVLLHVDESPVGAAVLNPSLEERQI